MGNLIRMDLYKIRKSKMTYICLLTAIALSVLFEGLVPMLLDLIGTSSELNDEMNKVHAFGNLITAPFLTTLMYLSAAHFSYIDISDGYIKNIAGQLANKGNTVISKFVAIAVHNLIFMMLDGFASGFAGMICYKVEMTNIAEGVCTLLIKWVLSLGVTALILLFTNGFKSNVLGYIVTILLAFGATNGLYMGIDVGLHKLGVSNDFSVGDYAAENLFGSVSVIENKDVVLGLVVAVIYICLFMWLTVTLFNKKDVK